MKKPVTQAEIAQVLGINQATVSCAFTDSPKVGPELRERIRRTALSMGYRPNASSRAIKSGSTGMIAVLLSTEGHRSYLPLSMQDAIIYAAQENDKLVIFSRFSDDKLTSEELMPRVLSELSVDGLILNYSHLVPPALDRIISNYKIPAIWINRDLPYDCVCPDDGEGAEMAVRRLYAMGHRRIAYLHAFPSPSPSQEPHSVKNRQDGYLRGMKKCGLSPMKPGLMDFDHVKKKESFNAWWDSFRTRTPTAVIGYQHADAPFFMMQMTRKGIRVPDDVSFVMFGDHQDRSMGIQLDYITLPEVDIGRIAVEMLMKKISRPAEKIPSRLTTPVWEKGESCVEVTAEIKTRRR